MAWMRTALAGLCLVMTPAGLHAADYVSEPIAQAVQLVEPNAVHESGLTAQGIFTETGSFDSNPLLLTSHAKPLYGSTTAPELILNESTPSLQANLDTTIDANAFNQTNFDSVDVHSTGGVTGEGPLVSAGIQEKIDYDTTRTSETSNFDLTTHPFRHLGTETDPEMAFTPTEIDKITVAGSYATSTYQSNIFSNFEVASVTPTYVHNFDPRNAGIFAIQAQHYETTDNLHSTTDNIGPSIGWITALTPELSAKVTAGAQTAHSTLQGSPSSPWSVQYIFSGDFTFKGQQNTAELVASRAEYPYGNGTEALLTSVTAAEAYRLNELLALDFGAGFQSSQYQVTQTGDVLTEWSGNLGFTYAVNDQVDVKTEYQFRYETLDNIQSRADEHVVTVSLLCRLNPETL